MLVKLLGTSLCSSAKQGALKFPLNLFSKGFNIFLCSALLGHEPAMHSYSKGGLGFLSNSISSELKEVILPLWSAVVRPHQECWVQYKRGTEWVQHRIVKELEHLSYKEWWRVLGPLSLEKSRLRRESYQCVQIPDGGSKEDRATAKGLEAMATNWNLHPWRC